MVIRWFCYASHTNNLIHSADAWKNAADLRFAAACWTWPVTTGACKEESSKCYHHSLISLDLPEINIKLNIHLYIIIYMHIFMTKSHFWCQKIPIGFIQLLLKSPSKYHPKIQYVLWWNPWWIFNDRSVHCGDPRDLRLSRAAADQLRRGGGCLAVTLAMLGLVEPDWLTEKGGEISNNKTID